MKTPLFLFNDEGIYSTQAQVYSGPWKPVKKAIITHGLRERIFGATVLSGAYNNKSSTVLNT